MQGSPKKSQPGYGSIFLSGVRPIRSRKTRGVFGIRKKIMGVASEKSGSPLLEIFQSSPLKMIARGGPQKFSGNRIAGVTHQPIISERGPLNFFKRSLLKIFQEGSGQIILGGVRLISSHTTRGGCELIKKFTRGPVEKIKTLSYHSQPTSPTTRITPSYSPLFIPQYSEFSDVKPGNPFTGP